MAQGPGFWDTLIRMLAGEAGKATPSGRAAQTLGGRVAGALAGGQQPDQSSTAQPPSSQPAPVAAPRQPGWLERIMRGVLAPKAPAGGR
jgi:hypothetical protein